MASCFCGKKDAPQTSRFVTITRPPFGKMNKSAEQLFTCFLAAAERYRAPKKEQEADLQQIPAEIRGIQSLEPAQPNNNTILETSKE